VTKNLNTEKSGDLLVTHHPQSKRSPVCITAAKTGSTEFSTCFASPTHLETARKPMSQIKNIWHSTFSIDDGKHLGAPTEK